jgi:putative DNA primase/helicase
MSQVQPLPLDWLWPGWVPLGKLTLLDGDPGQAKSLLLVDLAARAPPRAPDDQAINPTARQEPRPPEGSPS